MSSSSRSSSAAVTDGQKAYLASDASGAMLLRWTLSGGVLKGTVDASQLASDVSGGQAAITGTVSGNSVSFEVNGKTRTGTLDGSELVMHIPQADGSLLTLRFTPGDIDAYNAAIAALHGEGQSNAQATADTQNAANAAQAVANADRRVGDDLDTLASALQTLAADSYSSDIEAVNADLNSVREDYKQVQADVSAHDCDTAQSDAGIAASDAAVGDSDSATLDSDIATSELDVDQVRQDSATLAADLDALAKAENASPATAAQHGSAEVDHARAKVAPTTKAARDAEGSAKSQVAAIVSKAHHVADQAQALANGCA
jgi:hypothetical protein